MCEYQKVKRFKYKGSNLYMYICTYTGKYCNYCKGGKADTYRKARELDRNENRNYRC